MAVFSVSGFIKLQLWDAVRALALMHFSKNSNLGCGGKTIRSLSEGKVKRARVHPSGPPSHVAQISSWWYSFRFPVRPCGWYRARKSEVNVTVISKSSTATLLPELQYPPRGRLRLFENNDIVLSDASASLSVYGNRVKWKSQHTMLAAWFIDFLVGVQKYVNFYEER